MSSLAIAEFPALVTWDQFQKLPERPDNGKRHELHDGVVVVVPPARPVHLLVQARLLKLFRFAEEQGWTVFPEFPYRPAANYQFWYADLAVLPSEVLRAMADRGTWEIYSPPLIIEVLSPSNRPDKVARQRVAAMSNGTTEFWVVDAEKQTVLVSREPGVVSYKGEDSIPLTAFPGASVRVADIF